MDHDHDGDRSFAVRELARAKRYALAERDEVSGQPGRHRQFTAWVTRTPKFDRQLDADGKQHSVVVVAEPCRIMQPASAGQLDTATEGDEMQRVDDWALPEQYQGDAVATSGRLEAAAIQLAARGYELAAPFIETREDGNWHAPLTVRAGDRDEITRSLDRRRAMQNVQQTSQERDGHGR